MAEWRKGFEWLYDAVRGRQGRAYGLAPSGWQRLCLRRARSCLALATYSMDLASPEHEFSCEAIELLRSSCRWLLAYDAEGPSRRDALSRDNTSLPATMPQERWGSIQAVLARDRFEDARLSPEQAESDRDGLLSLAKDLLANVERRGQQGPEPLADWIRVAVPVAAAGLMVGALGGLIGVRDSLRANLADGRPWKTSSTFAVCDPAHASCADAVTDIFFHTQSEDSPWIEFDLGGRKGLRRVEVQNRSDCCQERAIPLVVEISDDEKTWAEVARRETPFGEWTARFPATQARYVRLRVARTSMLHLESVAIR
jgi:hypothetical protein